MEGRLSCATQFESQWWLEYPISILSLQADYPRLSPSKSEQVTKIVQRNMIGYCYLKATFISFILFHYQFNRISLHSHKLDLTKTYLASTVKSLVNQCFNKSDNHLQGAPHNSTQRREAIRFAKEE